MKYCILIILSQHTISFRYYRSDGKDDFLSFNNSKGDSSCKFLPLAILCQDNDFEIGSHALTEFHNGNSQAFGNIFDISKETKTFRYNSKQEPINKLLFMAIENHIDKYFFRNILFNNFGSVASNRSSLPLYLMFHSSLDNDSRLFLKKQFDDSGYSNVKVLDFNIELINKLKEDSLAQYSKHDFAVLTSNGENLYLELFDGKSNKICTHCLPGLGSDPRIKVGAEMLWNAMDRNWLRKEDEMPILEQVASDFILSGKYEFNDSILCSDGQYYHSFLQMMDLNDNTTIDTKLGLDVKHILNKEKIETQDCILVLRDKANSDYFYNALLTADFHWVYRTNENDEQQLFGNVLEDFKKPKPQLPESIRREIVMSRREIDVLIRTNNVSKAKEIILDNLNKLHSFENYEFDEEFAEKLSMCEPKDNPISETKSQAPEPQPKKKPVVENVRLNKREVKERVLDIKNLIKRGEDAKALSELRNLKDYEADVPEIAELIKQLDKPKVDFSDAQISSIKREIRELTASRKIDEAINLAKSTISQMDKTDKRINDLQQLIDKAITKRNN